MCGTSGLVLPLLPDRHLGVVAEFPRRQMLCLVLLRLSIRSQGLAFFFALVLHLLGLCLNLALFFTCLVLLCLLRLVFCRTQPVLTASTASASAPILPAHDVGVNMMVVVSPSWTIKSLDCEVISLD